MVYTKEEIERYLEILKSYNRTSSEVGEANRCIKCWNCHSDCFFENSGY